MLPVLQVFGFATSVIVLFGYMTVLLRHHWLELANHKPWRIYVWMSSLSLVVFAVFAFAVLQKGVTGALKQGGTEGISMW